MNVPLTEGKCTDITYEVFTGVCPAVGSSPSGQPPSSAPTNQPLSSTPSAQPLGYASPSNDPASSGPIGDLNPVGSPESNPPQTLTTPVSKVSVAVSHCFNMAFMLLIVHLLYRC